jgi:diphosphomevalonate decarboxylase
MRGNMQRHGLNQVSAQACANIALCKYWGKQGHGNAPATPSIGLALAELTTTTTVTRIKGKQDQVLIDGRPAGAEASKRVRDYLKLWRGRGLIEGCCRVESSNSFPTAAGLASSAAGYAALACALSAWSNVRLSPAQLSRLARLGSGSSARSIPGGLTALASGDDPAARLLAKAEAVPWGMVIAVIDSGKKAIGSRAGMELSRRTSPYYAQWVQKAQQHYRQMRRALRNWDLTRVGELMEENTLAMHACMLAAHPPLLYWRGATAELWQQVGRWRKAGLQVYATTDAGANVAVLCGRSDLRRVAQRVRNWAAAGGESGTVIAGEPGGPAHLISQS